MSVKSIVQRFVLGTGPRPSAMPQWRISAWSFIGAFISITVLELLFSRTPAFEIDNVPMIIGSFVSCFFVTSILWYFTFCCVIINKLSLTSAVRVPQRFWCMALLSRRWVNLDHALADTLLALLSVCALPACSSCHRILTACSGWPEHCPWPWRWLSCN
jgi:hypothetical protein